MVTTTTIYLNYKSWSDCRFSEETLKEAEIAPAPMFLDNLSNYHGAGFIVRLERDSSRINYGDCCIVMINRCNENYYNDCKLKQKVSVIFLKHFFTRGMQS